MAANKLFLVKLYDLLESGESQDVIRWNDEHRLVIFDPEQLVEVVNARGISGSTSYDSFGKLMRNYTFNVDKDFPKTPGIAYEKFWKSPVVNRSTSRDVVVGVQSKEKPKKSKRTESASVESLEPTSKASGGAGKPGKKNTQRKTKTSKVQPCPKRKRAKRGKSASSASYTPPSDSGTEEGTTPRHFAHIKERTRSPSSTCPELTYSVQENDSQPGSPLPSYAFEETVESLGSPLLQPVLEEVASLPDLPLNTKEILVDDVRTMFDDDLYDLRERDGILSHGPSSAIQHAYGLEAAEEEAREVKAISGVDPMWSVMWGVEDTPQATTSFVNGWWDYDEWTQDWGVVPKPDSIEIYGWY